MMFRMAVVGRGHQGSSCLCFRFTHFFHLLRVTRTTTPYRARSSYSSWPGYVRDLDVQIVNISIYVGALRVSVISYRAWYVAPGGSNGPRKQCEREVSKESFNM